MGHIGIFMSFGSGKVPSLKGLGLTYDPYPARSLP